MADGTPLREALFEHGVEFPCGGRGRCRGCRVRVIGGELPVTAADRKLLGEAELTAGWRLACQARVQGDLTLELAQWETHILADEAGLAIRPREGLGVAVDVGTTTLALQLLDLRSGEVLAVATALNNQAVHGADVMSRVSYAVHEGGAARLRSCIREQIGVLLEALCREAGRRSPVVEVVLVGNTVMHHAFAGWDLSPLAQTPFESPALGEAVFTGSELGWAAAAEATVRFLPCIGGFVGSDVLAGILATGLAEMSGPAALLDLGTNGEIVVAAGGRVVCASTAAGPAFEGGGIRMGMRAATGAICAVRVEGSRLVCEVLGGGEPRGLCGSGLVDAVACGLELGWIEPSGRIPAGRPVPLAGEVVLHPGDVRQLQLAKGAISAGLELLCGRVGVQPAELARLHLAGAFGNYINQANARRIGLLPAGLQEVVSVGNTALRGAKMVLLGTVDFEAWWRQTQPRISHIRLNEDPAFLETYAEAMAFPSRAAEDFLPGAEGLTAKPASTG